MNLYQHFRKEEHAFIDQVLQWKEAVATQYSAKLLDFLDPREQEIVRLVIGSGQEVKAGFFGGSEVSERKRALLYPDYYVPDDEDYELALFEISYPVKFMTIEHRQVLGSLMSLGLKRAKYGDILVNGDRIQFIAAREIADYIKMNLTSIGRSTVKVEERAWPELLESGEAWQEHSATASSLRLDTLLAAVHNISRQKAQTLIQSGLVKANWKVIEQTSFECGEGDTISVRGYGRFILAGIEGKTKKDKYRIIYKRLFSH